MHFFFLVQQNSTTECLYETKVKTLKEHFFSFIMDTPLNTWWQSSFAYLPQH